MRVSTSGSAYTNKPDRALRTHLALDVVSRELLPEYYRDKLADDRHFSVSDVQPQSRSSKDLLALITHTACCELARHYTRESAQAGGHRIVNPSEVRCVLRRFQVLQ